MYCSKGQVKLAPLVEYPEYFRELLSDGTLQAKHYYKNIRDYNAHLGFASCGSTLNRKPNPQPNPQPNRPHNARTVSTVSGRGPPVFRFQGQLYHDTSAAHAQKDHRPKYAQLYFIDSEEATRHRCERFVAGRATSNRLMEIERTSMVPSLLKHLDEQLRLIKGEEKELAAAEGRPVLKVGMVIHNSNERDPRRYNNPTCDQIAFVFKTADGAPPANRDIVGYLIVPQQGKNLIPIFTTQGMCDPMTYPLLFPHGEQG